MIKNNAQSLRLKRFNKEIKMLLDYKGATITSLAKEFKVSRGLIKKITIDLGIKNPIKRYRYKNKVIAMFKNNESISTISSIFSISQATVKRILTKEGLIKINGYKHFNPSQKEIDKILSMYFNGYSLFKIGRKFNKPHATISLFLRNSNVHMRKRGELLRKNEVHYKGYSWIYKPTHLRAAKSPRIGRIKKCWYIWEKNTGENLTKDLHIHHIDMDKRNDNFENLISCSNSEHGKIHKGNSNLLLKKINERKIKHQNWKTLCRQNFCRYKPLKGESDA